MRGAGCVCDGRRNLSEVFVGKWDHAGVSKGLIAVLGGSAARRCCMRHHSMLSSLVVVRWVSCAELLKHV